MIFQEFPKMARLNRVCVVTEKIDGTNASIVIAPGVPDATTLATQDGMVLRAGSRTRWITPSDDNFGFATWVQHHAADLFRLGEGQHFGEWWGRGIQRGYGLTERRFSLFNASRWFDPASRPTCCSVVPVLWEGPFNTAAIAATVDGLRDRGSVAAPGFMNPEGIVVWHLAANIGFKWTLEHDDVPKTKAPRR